MERVPVERRNSRGRRRRAGVVTCLVGALALAGGVYLAPLASAACKEPPCGGGGDDGGGGSTTTTTAPAPNWSARVTLLNQSGGPIDPSVSGVWRTLGSPHYVTYSGDVAWSDAAHDEGTVALRTVPLPTSPVGFTLTEWTGDGPLCRSQLMPTVAPSGRTIRVLVGDKISLSPTNLQDLANGLVGRVSPDPDDAQVTINDATLVAHADGLHLTIHGHLTKSEAWGAIHVDAGFTYTDVLHIQTSRVEQDPAIVMTVHADQGELKLDGDGWSDDVLIDMSSNEEPAFRAAVQDQATAKVNATVAQNPDAQWFGSLGYTVSVRSVTTSDSGVTVMPSLCKVE